MAKIYKTCECSAYNESECCCGAWSGAYDTDDDTELCGDRTMGKKIVSICPAGCKKHLCTCGTKPADTNAQGDGQPLNALLCVKKLQYAANCALWLLSQPELRELMEGDWGDPIDTKRLLEEAGCQPNCENV